MGKCGETSGKVFSARVTGLSEACGGSSMMSAEEKNCMAKITQLRSHSHVTMLLLTFAFSFDLACLPHCPRLIRRPFPFFAFFTLCVPLSSWPFLLSWLPSFHWFSTESIAAAHGACELLIQISRATKWTLGRNAGSVSVAFMPSMPSSF